MSRQSPADRVRAKFDRLTSSFEGCQAVSRALDVAEASLRLTVSRGRARGGGQSSKAKGRAAVVVVRDLLRDVLGIPEGDMVVKATSMPGADLYVAPAHRERFPFAIEAKSVEALNIWKSLAQARENAGDLSPIVFFKRSRTSMFVALDADRFLELVAIAYGNQGRHREDPQAAAQGDPQSLPG